jgi:hypothetical protein
LFSGGKEYLLEVILENSVACFVTLKVHKWNGPVYNPLCNYVHTRLYRFTNNKHSAMQITVKYHSYIS